jgi:tetratricopeptide (TPR) repeat protein
LAQVASDDALLRQLDLDDSRPYPVKAADIQQVTALVEASPGYLSRRMRFLESKLSGQHRVVLSASPQAIEEKLAGGARDGGGNGASAAKHVRPRVALWTRPYETLSLRATDNEAVLAAAEAALSPLQSLLRPVSELATDRRATVRRDDSPEWIDSQQRRASRPNMRVALGVGRMQQLAGNFHHETGAIRFLQQAILSEADQAQIKQALIDDLRSKLPRPDDPATRKQIELIAETRAREFRRADEAAKLWIGQIKATQGEFETAIDYFQRWENELWQPSINYSLARVYEAQGKVAEAIVIYREDDSPQRPGNLVRARRLESANR